MCTIHLLSLTAAHMPKHLLSEVSEKCAGEKKVLNPNVIQSPDMTLLPEH